MWKFKYGLKHLFGMQPKTKYNVTKKNLFGLYLYFMVYIDPLFIKKMQISHLSCLIDNTLVIFIYQRLTTT